MPLAAGQGAAVGELTPRQARIDGLLERWADAGGQSSLPGGYPAESPQYRMMRQGMTPAGTGSQADRWRHRTVRTADGVRVRPAQTAYGRDSGGLQMPDLTAPERSAARGGRVATIDHIVRHVLVERQQMIVYARYMRRLRTHQEVAAALGLNRNYVGPATVDILDLIDRMLFAQAP